LKNNTFCHAYFVTRSHDVVGGGSPFHVSTKVTAGSRNAGVGRKTAHVKCKILSIYMNCETCYAQLGHLWQTLIC